MYIMIYEFLYNYPMRRVYKSYEHHYAEKFIIQAVHGTGTDLPRKPALFSRMAFISSFFLLQARTP